MIESKFRLAVIQRLQQVALEERRTWDENKLFQWWMAQVSANPTVEHGATNPWQAARSAATGMYGPEAVT